MITIEQVCNTEKDREKWAEILNSICSKCGKPYSEHTLEDDNTKLVCPKE